METKYKCKECGTTQCSGWYSETRKVDYFFSEKEVTTTWCEKCYKEKFIKEINACPQALSKYINIYGKRPEKVLNK